jgi:hypothetical protein
MGVLLPHQGGQREPRPMQPALHRRQAHAQQLRCGVTRQFLKITQRENFTVIGGEARKRRARRKTLA